jgi:hypothetical protein
MTSLPIKVDFSATLPAETRDIVRSVIWSNIISRLKKKLLTTDSSILDSTHGCDALTSPKKEFDKFVF